MDDKRQPAPSSQTADDAHVDFSFSPPLLDSPTLMRDNYIDALSAKAKDHHWVHIFGLPGVGKSTVVTQWLFNNPDIRKKKIIWLSCSDTHSIDQQILLLAKSTSLGSTLNYSGDEFSGALQCVKEFIQSENDIVWILDDINPDSLNDLNSKIPCRLFKGTVVSTSNEINTKEFGNFCLPDLRELDDLKIEPLSQTETQELIGKLLKDDTSYNNKLPNHFYEYVVGLPIAIRSFCAHYSEKSADDFEEYCASIFTPDPHANVWIPFTMKPLEDSLSIFTQYLRRKSMMQSILLEEFLALASDLNRHPIPLEWGISATGSNEKFLAILNECKSMGIFKIDRTSKTFSMSPPYRTAVQALYQYKRSLNLVIKNAQILQKYFSYLVINENDKNINELTPYAPHVFRILQRLEERYPSDPHLTEENCRSFIELSSSLARYYFNRGQLTEAFSCLKTCHHFFKNNNLLTQWNIELYQVSTEQFASESRDEKRSPPPQENLLKVYAQEILLQLGIVSSILALSDKENPVQESITWLETSYYIQRNVKAEQSKEDSNQLALAYTLQYLIRIYRKSNRRHLRELQLVGNSDEKNSHHKATNARLKKNIEKIFSELNKLVGDNKTRWEKNISIRFRFEIEFAILDKEHQDDLDEAKRDYKPAIQRLSSVYDALKVNHQKQDKKNLISVCQYLGESYLANREILKSIQFFLEMLYLSRESINDFTPGTAYAYYSLAKICMSEGQYLGLAAVFVNFALRDQNHIYNKDNLKENLHEYVQKTIDLAITLANKIHGQGALSLANIEGESAKYTEATDDIIINLSSPVLEAKHRSAPISTETLGEISEKIILALKNKADDLSLGKQAEDLKIVDQLYSKMQSLQSLKREQDKHRQAHELQKFLSTYTQAKSDSAIVRFSQQFETSLLQGLDDKLKRVRNIAKPMTAKDFAGDVINALSNIIPEFQMSATGPSGTVDLKQVLIGINTAMIKRRGQLEQAQSENIALILKDPDELEQKLISRIHRMSIYVACCYKTQLEILANNSDVLNGIVEKGTNLVVSYLCQTSPIALRSATPEELVVLALVDNNIIQKDKSLGKINGYSWSAVGMFKTAVRPYGINNPRLRLRKSMDATELATYGTRFGSPEEFSLRSDWNEYPDETQAKSAIEKKPKCIIC